MSWASVNPREWINLAYFTKLIVLESPHDITIEGFDALNHTWVTLEQGFEFADDAVTYLEQIMESTSMDKQIRKIEKEVKHSGKDLKKLEQMDKKRDKVCGAGEKAMKMKKNKK